MAKKNTRESAESTPESDTGNLATEIMTVSSSARPAYSEARINNLLESELGITTESESSIKSVSKELFTKKEIDVKTEVSHDEIIHVTKLRFLEERFKLKSVDQLIGSFLTLRVSMQRKSRQEFIKALSTEQEAEQSGGLLKKLFGGNKT